jgi:hypothetical protein
MTIPIPTRTANGKAGPPARATAALRVAAYRTDAIPFASWYPLPMKIKRLTDTSDTFDLNFRTDKPFDLVGFGLNAVDHLCVVPRYPRFDTKTEILHYERLAGGQTATAGGYGRPPT